MKYDLNKKNKFIARVAVLFTLLISFGLLAQAQPSSLAAQLKRQEDTRKMLERNNIIAQITSRIINTVAESGKRGKTLSGGLKPVIEPLSSSAVFAPITLSPPALSDLLNGAPTVFIQPAPVQSRDSQKNRLANAISSPAVPSDVQSVKRLNVAGNLGDGTSVLRDAAGQLYSIRLAGAPRAAQPTKRRARR